MTDELPDDIPDEDSDLEDVIRFAHKTAITMVQTIHKAASDTKEKAAARARDARTLNELVRTLERLDALETSHRAQGRKTKWKHDSELKAALVRRLDQLLESAKAADGAGKHRGKGSGAS